MASNPLRIHEVETLPNTANTLMYTTQTNTNCLEFNRIVTGMDFLG